MSLVQRLLSHTTVTRHGLIWTGSFNVRNGYGQIRAKRADGTWTTRQVHRVWYELQGNVIPTGYDVDHECRRRECLSHLRAVPHVENRTEGSRFYWRAHRDRVRTERRRFVA